MLERSDKYKAGDFTDVKCIESLSLYDGNVIESNFVCNLCGKPYVLTETQERHDEGCWGFTIHSKPEDIWFQLSLLEIQKLELVLEEERIYFPYDTALKEAKNEEDLREIWYSFIEEENFPKSLWERFKNAFVEKKEELGIEEEREEDI